MSKSRCENWFELFVPGSPFDLTFSKLMRAKMAASITAKPDRTAPKAVDSQEMDLTWARLIHHPTLLHRHPGRRMMTSPSEENEMRNEIVLDEECTFKSIALHNNAGRLTVSANAGGRGLDPVVSMGIVGNRDFYRLFFHSAELRKFFLEAAEALK